ncbi:acyltransferase family protein [Calothrix sp. 336/3]|uniref:acyltransferase family protein n=1 Tax=Calothrix sp. 336/3 TaxID=1337936 RepID=UPI000624D32A|nr:acyltransferase [Calothrix sp. 336/3]AKG20617.1 acyltransferase [Calothrix sp. 336/3]
MPNPNRLDILLALRGLACLMVVMIHCAPPRNFLIYKNFDFSWILFSHGAVAVWIFFCLSGYLMGKAFYTRRYTLEMKSVVNFFRNRILRIFPLYYFAVLILVIFVYPEILKLSHWGYLLRVLTFTYQPYLTPQPLAFNDVFWSLSTEVQFYLCVPLIYSFFNHYLSTIKQIYFTFISILIITFILRCFSWITFHQEITDNMGYAFKYWYTPLTHNLDLFLSGFLINPLLKNTKSLPLKHLYIWKILAITLLIVLYLFSAHHLYHQELWGIANRPSGWRTATTILILPLVTALITAWFIFVFELESYHLHGKNRQLSISAILENPLRILEILGNLSYGIYIWHYPIIGKIYPIFTADIPIAAFYTRFTATLILSMIMATVTYFLVEIPGSKWKSYSPS